MKTSESDIQECFQFGPFRLDPASRTLWHRDKRVTLPSKAFDALLVLVQNHGNIVDKATLLSLVWPDTVVEENNLAKSIAVIRKALEEEAGECRYVVTVPGRGYSFVATVSQAGPEKPEALRKLRTGTAGVCLAITAVVIIGVFLWFWVGRSPSQPRLMTLTGSPGLEMMPAFSPDGRQIVYAWKPEGENYFSLYIKLIGPGQPLRLTSGKDANLPAWSPDGRYIAYYSSPPGIYLIPALGGPERKLATLRTAARFAWFPDSQRLAIVDLDPATGFPSIFELSMETGERRKLTSAVSSFGDVRPAISPDGKTLGFVRSVAGAVMGIYLMPVAGGEPRRLTGFEEWAVDFAWTADSRDVVYTTNRLGFTTLWRLPVAGGTRRRVTDAGYDVASPAIALAENRMAFARRTITMNLWRVDLGQPGPPRKLAGTTRTQKAPHFSPDGKRLAFESSRSGWNEVWTSDSEGGNLVQLTSMGALDTFAGTPRWSPDGAEIVFDARPGSNPDIFVVNAQGGAPRRITTDPAEDVVPSFSRDGRWIYFASNRSGQFEVWKAPRLGGDAVQVTRQGGFAPMESPDGKYLYYAKQQHPTDLWSVPPAGGREARLFPGSSQLRNWRSWDVTDRGVVYIDGNSTLKLFNATTGEVRKLTTLPKAPPDFAISPDGRTVVYSQLDDVRSNILLLEDFR